MLAGPLPARWFMSEHAPVEEKRLPLLIGVWITLQKAIVLFK